jgi:hypothetical protein
MTPIPFMCANAPRSLAFVLHWLVAKLYASTARVRPTPGSNPPTAYSTGWPSELLITPAARESRGVGIGAFVVHVPPAAANDGASTPVVDSVSLSGPQEMRPKEHTASGPNQNRRFI